MKKPKIGLALGGGAARGLAHVGVLEVLHRAGVAVDMVAGTSAGALIGALYAAGMSPARIKKLVREELDWLGLASLIDITLSKTGFIKGRKLLKALRDVFGGEPDFSALKLPFACVAVDLNTAEEIVISEGSVLEAVRASISIPGIFMPVWRDKRCLVDGVLMNPVPVDVTRRMGADFVIAVNVLPPFGGATGAGEDTSAPPVADNILSILLQSAHVMALPRLEKSLAAADMVIQPEVGYLRAEEFHRVREFIIQGEMAAEQALPALKKKLRSH